MGQRGDGLNHQFDDNLTVLKKLTAGEVVGANVTSGADPGHTHTTGITVTHASTTGQTTDDHHAQSHNVASHSDTTATGTELDTLTDDSMANALHRHSELSASDGTPDQAVYVDASGKVGIGTVAPGAKLDVSGGSAKIGFGYGYLLGATGDNLATYSLSVPNASPYTARLALDADSGTKRAFEVGYYTSNNTANAWNPSLHVEASGGNVGIGTTSPTQKLEVAGVAKITGTLGGNNNLIINRNNGNALFQFNNDDNGVSSYQQYSTDGSTITNKISGTSAYPTYFNAGNVGIGTTSPRGLLELEQQGNAVNQGLVISDQQTGAWQIYKDQNHDLNFRWDQVGIKVQFADGGDAWFVGDVSALTFTDRTPFYDGDALSEIKLIKGIDGEIDHDTLPEFVKVVKEKEILDEELKPTGEKEITTERSLSNMVSVLVKAVQQLTEEVDALKIKNGT